MRKLTIITRSKPVCPGCETMKAILIGEGVLHEVLDITNEPDIIEDFGISAVPTLIVHDEGVEVNRYTGVVNAETIKGALQ